MWKEARGDRGNIHSPSVAEECRGEREGKSEGREGGSGGGSKERRPFSLCFGGVERGEEISPKYLTLLKVLRRGLQFAFLTGRGLLLQVLQGEKGTNQNGPSPQTDPWRGRVWGRVFVPEWLCFLKSSSPLRTNRLFWHFVLSPRSRMKGCSCLQTNKHFQEVAASFSSRVFETEAKTDGNDTNRKWLSVRVTGTTRRLQGDRFRCSVKARARAAHPSYCRGSGRTWLRSCRGGTRRRGPGWGWCCNCFLVSPGMSQRWSSGCCCRLQKHGGLL